MTVKLKRIVAEFTAGLLNDGPNQSMCFVVSSALAGFLNFAGYGCELTRGLVCDCEHYWLTLADGQIVDATASQFNEISGAAMPDIYIGEKPSWYSTEH